MRLHKSTLVFFVIANLNNATLGKTTKKRSNLKTNKKFKKTVVPTELHGPAETGISIKLAKSAKRRSKLNKKEKVKKTIEPTGLLDPAVTEVQTKPLYNEIVYPNKNEKVKKTIVPTGLLDPAATEVQTEQIVDTVYPVTLNVPESKNEPFSNSDLETKRFIISYKKGSAPLLPLSNILGGSGENNFVVAEILPEFAARMNESDDMHVEEDVPYELIKPIIPEGDQGVPIHSNSTSEQYSLLQSNENHPYGIALLKAPQVSRVWMYAPRTPKICIIDTGYNYEHTDLPKANVSGNSGTLNRDNDWKQDGHGHGTHVAGVIGALNNLHGVVGIAPNWNLPLYIVRAFNDRASFVWASDVISMIQECVDAGSNVINMSLGRTGERLRSEIDAYRKFLNVDNVIVVSACGNSAKAGNAAYYPAAYDDVIGVASVGGNKIRSSFSTHNSNVDLAAPGDDIFSTYKNGGYRTLSGTSMASPHVAGVAALVWSHFQSSSAIEIRNALFNSAEDLGTPGRDNYYGHGLVNAKAAYDLLGVNKQDDANYTFRMWGKGKKKNCAFLREWVKKIEKNYDVYQAMIVLDQFCFQRDSNNNELHVFQKCKETCFKLGF